MNIKQKIEGWLFNVYGGKLVARGAVLAAALVSTKLLPFVAASTGVVIPFTEAQVLASLTAAFLWAFEEIKRRRMANPASPAVQTDAKAPGADVSAAAAAQPKN